LAKLKKSMSEGWLGLKTRLGKDVYRLIFSRLCRADWVIVNVAHMSQKKYLIFCNHFDLICRNCAKYGHLALLKWLTALGNQFYATSSDICRVAAKHGQLSILRWMALVCIPGLNPRTESSVLLKAARNGHLHILEWINPKHDQIRVIAAHAAFKGRVNVLEWLVQNMWDLGPDLCTEAAGNGKLRALQWLVAHGANWDELTTQYAIINGHLDVLKWAIEHGCPYYNTNACMSDAINRNQIHVVEWLYERGFPIHESAPRYAIIYGHLEVLQWMYAKVPLLVRQNRQLCIEHATQSGNSLILEWLLNETG
jgi:hypothetical protein